MRCQPLCQQQKSACWTGNSKMTSPPKKKKGGGGGRKAARILKTSAHPLKNHALTLSNGTACHKQNWLQDPQRQSRFARLQRTTTIMTRELMRRKMKTEARCPPHRGGMDAGRERASLPKVRPAIRSKLADRERSVVTARWRSAAILWPRRSLTWKMVRDLIAVDVRLMSQFIIKS